jgi:formylglycine-generating enzyme required for sulfatase activity
MKKILLTAIAFIIINAPTGARAQVTIGSTANPQSFSILQLESNNARGMRLPQMSNIQRDNMVETPAFQAEKTGKALGLQIFNKSTKCVETWNGTKWIQQCPQEGPAQPPVSPQVTPSACITPDNPSDGGYKTFTAKPDPYATAYEFFVKGVSKGDQDGYEITFPTAQAATDVTVKYYYPPSFLKPKMIEVAGGKFTIGSATQNSYPIPNNSGDVTRKGSYEVELTGFNMSETPITQAQYEAVMGINPSQFQCSTDPDYAPSSAKPVEMVNWFDAIIFCNKLSIMEGKTPCYSIASGGTGTYTPYTAQELAALPYNSSEIPDETNHTNYIIWNSNVACDWTATGYRLPTEAEWEYAARGGQLSESNKSNGKTKDFFYSGSNDINKVAWYLYNIPDNNSGNSGYGTQAVKGKDYNALGLYDMSGNVFEWCWNWYDESHQYSGYTNKDPRGATTVDYVDSKRVSRGGFWGFTSEACNVSVRAESSPCERNVAASLRVVCSVVTQ